MADYFPSIDIDPVGDLGMTFMESSKTEYMSMYVTGQLKGAAAGTMLTPVLAQAGVTTYYLDSTGRPTGPEISAAWGSIPATDRSGRPTNTPSPPSRGANFGTWIQQFTIQAGTGTLFISLGNGGDGIGVAGQSNILIGGPARRRQYHRGQYRQWHRSDRHRHGSSGRREHTSVPTLGGVQPGQPGDGNPDHR